ncbi:MAG: M14 family zinc carboxypeptidase [Planctomycetota bacterium]|jgi:hypothetical protein
MKLVQSSIVIAMTLVLFSLAWSGPFAQRGPAVYSPGAKGVEAVQTDEKSGEISVTLAISPPKLKEITSRNGGRYIQLELEGRGNDNVPGRAALPIINHVVEVPWGTEVTARPIRRHFKELSVRRRLYPYQRPIPKVPGPAGNPPFELDEQFYSGSQSNAFRMAAGGDKVQVKTFRKRGRHYAKLTIRPFRYNPGRGLVRYPSEVILKVTYTRQLPKAAGPRLGVISVVEVKIAERKELEELIEAGYNISNVRGNIVTIYATQEELEVLRDAGYTPVKIEQQQLSKVEERKAGKKGLGVYHNYATLTAELEAYAADHNNICRLSSLGTSVQGRELLAVKITDNPDVEEDEPEFKYVSTIHGDEPVGTEMCLYFINMLLTNYASDPNITELIDSTEIWIVPLMNPDGLELGTRSNADGYDLNRSFPEGSSDAYTDIFNGPYNNTDGRPTEVAHMMRWSQRQSFVLAANFHTGALVVNYPYDNDNRGNVDSPTPDDLLFEDVSRRYSMHNPPMWNSPTFPDGITNGAAWYVVSGGMQDWNYRYISDNEVTIELSDIKIPPEAELPDFWNDNRESMLAYLEAVHSGIRGIVTDRVSGKPLWADIRVEGIGHPVFSDPNVGDYHRMLLPGTYNLVVTAPGYKRTNIPDVNVVDGAVSRVDVALEPAQATIIAVTHDNLAAGAAEYVAQKQDEGYDVHLITLTGSPSADDVRNQVRTHYSGTYADFVVIIGDVENVPTFYSGGDASDLLYGLMDSGEGFGDYLGKEMMVGRISLDTNAEISDYVSKLASFVGSERHNKAAWISGGGNTWENNVCEQTHDWVIEYCIPPDFNNVQFYRDAGSAAELTEYINNGTDAVVYSGHGSSSGWMRYGYSLTHLAQHTNYLDTPIVFGHCCLTTTFGDDNCFAENWIKTTERGIVYIGGSDNTYWIEDDVMEKAEFLAMANDSDMSIAHAIDYGLERVDDLCPSMAQYYYTIYQVIGDPTVRLFSVACPELGRLKLDRSAYSCSAVIGIELRDCSPGDPVAVDVNSTTEPAGETVILIETPSGSGRFVGSIQTDSDVPASDARVQVSHGDTVVVTYQDPNDGTGNPAVVQNTVIVDCFAPLIFDVATGDIKSTTAVVTFNTDEPACGIVRYGLSCGVLTQMATGDCGQTSHLVNLFGLNPNTTYFFEVDAEDAAGNMTTDANDGACYTFTTVDQQDYFSELFDAGDNDLDNLSITFTPDGSANFYSVCTEESMVFPTDPSGGTTISLSNNDDGYGQVILSGVTVSLYGTSYTYFYVGSNGYITFTAGDADYTETFEDHFGTERISALFDDLDLSSSGSVSWKQLGDRIAVTWQNVPEYSASNSNSLQIEMFFDGTIRVTWLGIAATDGLVGLSEGNGVPEDFDESDLSAYGPCLPTPPTAYDASAEVHINTTVDIELLATDDGFPEPPTLTYSILSLPSDGSLSDPCAGAINSVPYALAEGGNVVTYSPDPNYTGPDSFTFDANDGGIPPDGGASSEATISLTVIDCRPSEPNNPSPPDGATDMLVETVLTWNSEASALRKSAWGRLTAESRGLPDVAICAADYYDRLTDIQAKLLGTGQFNSVSIIDSSAVTPTLAELQAFDAVQVHHNLVHADATALGNVMADYVDSGGGVVCMVYEIGGAVNPSLGGRWATDGYVLMNRTGNIQGSQAYLGTVHVPSHPIMAGVSSFDGGSHSARPVTTTVYAGVTLVAEWSDGHPLVSVKQINGTPRADVTFYPPSSDVGSGYWLSSTDGDLLMANALAYVSRVGDDMTWDVYLGTDPCSLELICEDINEPTCDPYGLLLLDCHMTYYWQIVAKNSCGEREGPLWSFTTGAAGDFDGDCDVDSGDCAIFALAWLSQPGDAQWNHECDIYEPNIINFLDFAVLADNWRAGRIPIPGQASNPFPADGVTGVSITADLSWTAGGAVTSHDVYFGTSSPPPFIRNEIATTFDPGTMTISTTYFWRVDEVGPYGTTPGTIWSFATGGPPPK